MEAQPIERIARSLRVFTRLEASSGILLLAAMAVALGWANSPGSEAYFRILESPLAVRIGPWGFTSSLRHAVNDGLMAVFFFVVGLEIKRELVAGELAGIRKAAFPAVAALGGMLVPALLYAACNRGQASLRGWGIPTATDIAFALGILALLGKRIPGSVKIFLMALAIIDDLGAVVVIAVFYSGKIAWGGLGWAALIVAFLFACNRAGLRKAWCYAVPGIALWYCLQHAGVHGTIAGVLAALAVPARADLREGDFASHCRAILDRFQAARFREETPILNQERLEAVMELEDACEKVEPPLQRLVESLHPWTSFGILPLFAWANAGVRVDPAILGALGGPSGIGIALGLVVGKPLGIFGAAQAMLALGFPRLSGGATWKHLLGAGLLGGIGFTMSIFIAGLAFGEGRPLDAAKVAVFLSSALAGALGYAFLRSLPPAGGAEDGAGAGAAPSVAGADDQA
jgi:NhaA family Na+:H+ antiporter